MFFRGYILEELGCTILFNELTLTSEGRETTYVVNVLSHYVLTKGLVEGGTFNNDAVVVNMTSGGMYNAPLGTAGLNTTDPAKFNGKASYAYAKRAQVALTATFGQGVEGDYQKVGLFLVGRHAGRQQVVKQPQRAARLGQRVARVSFQARPSSGIQAF